MSTPVMIITGTSKGIGKGLAEHFLNKGYRVFGCSRGEATITHAA
ncbi:MAG TPA: SDR family NAD(P)-dependent oxidoreductase, partial [bacterium]|nr:SDR family NAD(P)-dependent oxidoreductase [bacterium]